MKILITTDWYTPAVNGVVTSVLNLRRELMAMGHEVRVLTLSNTPHSHEAGGVTYIGAVGAGKIYPGARLRTAPARQLLQELIDWSPDIIHTQCEFSTFLMARSISKATGAPVIHTYHTVYEDYTHYFSPSRKWGRAVVSFLSRWVVNQTAAVVAPTVKVRGILERYRVSRPIFVVPTGIDLRRFSNTPEAVYLANLRRTLDIPENRFVALYVGRLAKEKNIGELLQGIADLRRSDITLLLVGDGPYRGELESQARQLGIAQNVVFAGMVAPSQIAEYYRLGNVFVSASSSETQGLTYLEALASGLPLLCRKDPCLTGVIADAVNGWQFHDAGEFQCDLLRLLNDPALRVQMSRAALGTRSEFSAEMFAERILSVYDQILGVPPADAGAA